MVVPDICKDGWSEKKFKTRFEGKIDAVIIGSGISGLTVAGLLSRAGYRVLVLEQHDRAGGTLHTFEEKGFEFDTGVHYCGSMVAHSAILRRLSGGKVPAAESSTWRKALEGSCPCSVTFAHGVSPGTPPASSSARWAMPP